MDSSIIQHSILTLNNETEAEAPKGQVSKHRLFWGLASKVTFCVAVVKLEGQRKLSGFNILFDLKEKHTERTALKQTDFLQKLILVLVKWLLGNWNTKKTVLLLHNLTAGKGSCIGGVEEER